MKRDFICDCETPSFSISLLDKGVDASPKVTLARLLLKIIPMKDSPGLKQNMSKQSNVRLDDINILTARNMYDCHRWTAGPVDIIGRRVILQGI